MFKLSKLVLSKISQFITETRQAYVSHTHNKAFQTNFRTAQPAFLPPNAQWCSLELKMMLLLTQNQSLLITVQLDFTTAQNPLTNVINIHACLFSATVATTLNNEWTKRRQQHQSLCLHCQTFLYLRQMSRQMNMHARLTVFQSTAVTNLPSLKARCITVITRALTPCYHRRHVHRAQSGGTARDTHLTGSVDAATLDCSEYVSAAQRGRRRKTMLTITCRNTVQAVFKRCCNPTETVKIRHNEIYIPLTDFER